MPPHRSGRVSLVAAAVVLVASLTAGACSFERRPDPLAGATGSQATTVEDSVRAVALALDGARRLGDLAAAAALFESSARTTPLHPEERGAGRWLTPGEALAGGWAPGTVNPHPEEVLESSVELLGGGSALVLNTLVDPEAEGMPAALETLVLVRTPGGWRIRHLHRSPTDAPQAP